MLTEATIIAIVNAIAAIANCAAEAIRVNPQAASDFLQRNDDHIKALRSLLRLEGK